MIERITKASGLISADEFHFFRIFPAHLLQIFQYKPVVGGYRLPVFDLIPVKAVAAKCVVFFMDIHSYPEAPGQLEVKYSSISEIVGDATDIVKVSILEQTVEMLDGYPQTHTTVQVHETYKGDVSVGENLVVIEEGGQDNKVMGGIPQMSKNSNYILFLTEYSGKYYICGAFQGRFIIRDNYVFQQATEDAKLTTYAPAKIDDFVMAVQNDIKTK